MQFQILNNGEPMTMAEINAIAAKFWGKQVVNGKYAAPYDAMGADWFNNVGLQIANIENDPNPTKNQWDKVVARFAQMAALGENTIEGFNASWELYLPYVELCFHMKRKGLVPISL
jgi:hypothetical protein